MTRTRHVTITLAAAVLAVAGASALLPVAADAPAQAGRPATRPATGPATAPAAEARRAKPDKDLAPGEVVRIVVDALRDNDAKDNGIAITFDFASPANQKATGPLERFVPLVKSPAYAPMLNHRSAEYGTRARAGRRRRRRS
jgi:hypothetical protein